MRQHFLCYVGQSDTDAVDRLEKEKKTDGRAFFRTTPLPAQSNIGLLWVGNKMSEKLVYFSTYLGDFLVHVVLKFGGLFSTRSSKIATGV